jgi:hypothetical protein
LIEKVKKEPDTELLISPALKEKILLKEGLASLFIQKIEKDK